VTAAAEDTAPLPPLDRGRGQAIVDAARDAHVVVLGDVMLDHFMVGRVSRVSPEAPVPIVEFEREFMVPGGAANVAGNARALGARVTLVGVVGDDPAAAEVRGLLEARGIAATGLIVDAARPTTRKTRLATTRNQQVARIDVERAGDVEAPIEDALCAAFDAAAGSARVLVVSDYLKGTVTERVMKRVVAAAQRLDVPLLVDPKVPHMGRYAGATLLTPNHHEAEAASGVRIRSAADARRAARRLAEHARVEGVLITWGEHGLWLTHGAVEGHLPATAREVADVTGAGDTVVAAMGVALAAGATTAEAARLANEAAGVVVTRFGTSVVTAADLRQRLAAGG
jgi:D-beta-D-heptose 7-phosphate kinase/D-beta-D-heptose 1-phosphate adenosyltransferase